jgi:hypothetical protein
VHEHGGALAGTERVDATARLATDAGLAGMRLGSRRALTDEHADFVQVLAAGASDLLTVAAEAVPRSP